MNIKIIAAGVGILTLAACGQAPQDPAALRGANFVTNAAGTDITLSFAADQMRVNGRVVNIYNGTYTADGDKISFGPFASTMMMGPADAMTTEQEYFKFMSTVQTYRLKDGKLTLKNGDGIELVFTQVENLPSPDAVVVDEEVVEIDAPATAQ